MTARNRLSLEASFLTAASYDVPTSPMRSVDRAKLDDQTARVSADNHLRRPSPQSRAQGADYSGETMARYISGLETRLATHIQKHAPNWLEKEKHKILNRWSAPQPKPAPRWAPPPNREKDARAYAETLLKERLRARMQRVSGIRIDHALGGEASYSPRPKIRMKA